MNDECSVFGPIEGTSNLNLVDAIGDGFSTMRALTMALSLPRHLDEDAIRTLANMAFSVNDALGQKVEALQMRLGVIAP